jgi:hypothetical protein
MACPLGIFEKKTMKNLNHNNDFPCPSKRIITRIGARSNILCAPFTPRQKFLHYINKYLADLNIGAIPLKRGVAHV